MRPRATASLSRGLDCIPWSTGSHYTVARGYWTTCSVWSNPRGPESLSITHCSSASLCGSIFKTHPEWSKGTKHIGACKIERCRVQLMTQKSTRLQWRRNWPFYRHCQFTHRKTESSTYQQTPREGLEEALLWVCQFCQVHQLREKEEMIEVWERTKSPKESPGRVGELDKSSCCLVSGPFCTHKKMNTGASTVAS